SPKPRFRDYDQLLDLSGVFGECRTVGERQIRIDFDQNVALADGLTDAGDATFQWNHASAVDALHHAGPVRIADHPADQIDRGPHGFRLGDSGPDLQETLRWFGDECRAVSQPARCVAHSGTRSNSRDVA